MTQIKSCVRMVALEWGGGGDDGEDPVKSMEEHWTMRTSDLGQLLTP